jgi:hypothetical protein
LRDFQLLFKIVTIQLHFADGYNILRPDQMTLIKWKTGPEMQVLDNARPKDGRDAKTSAGSNYALHAPIRDVTRPVGEYNAVRLIVNGTHIEHWLNGVKILEYEIGSPDWEALVAASKFAAMPKYGRNRKGHIVL